MKYIRVYETSSKSEIVGIKIAFNSVGLRYRVLFENTLDMAASYGTGSRGAILEVIEEDKEVVVRQTLTRKPSKLEALKSKQVKKPLKKTSKPKADSKSEVQPVIIRKRKVKTKG